MWLTLLVGVVVACVTGLLFSSRVISGDSLMGMIWGRQLVDGDLSTFVPGPTPHPLVIGIGGLTSLLGDTANYSVTSLLYAPVALALLVAAAFDLAWRLASPFAAALAALTLLTSPSVLGAGAIIGYDLLFVALVMTALASCQARPQRMLLPLGLLCIAGLLRPEGWLLAGAFWLWTYPRFDGRHRALNAALVLAAPALWMLMDAAVTGDPLHSFHHTDGASERLYRQYTPVENLADGGRNFVGAIGLITVLLIPFSVVALMRGRPRKFLPMVVALVVPLAVYLLLVARGMASNERYLLLPACLLMVLAAAALIRRPYRPALVVAVGSLLALQVIARMDTPQQTRDETRQFVQLDRQARLLVARPDVRRMLRSCPRITVAGLTLIARLSFYSGRAPDRFVLDEEGRARTSIIHIAPATPAAAETMLTRPRFDSDATFRVAPHLRPGPSTGGWRLHVDRQAACVRA